MIDRYLFILLQQVAPPYEPLKFPLSDEQYEKLKSMNPPDDSKATNDDRLNSKTTGMSNVAGSGDVATQYNNNTKNLDDNSIVEHNVTIPELGLFGLGIGESDDESLDSAIPEEDPDDPEWCDDTIT